MKKYVIILALVASACGPKEVRKESVYKYCHKKSGDELRCFDDIGDCLFDENRRRDSMPWTEWDFTCKVVVQ